jgi:hypothetical protein
MSKTEKMLWFIFAAFGVSVLGITFWALAMYPCHGVGW